MKKKIVNGILLVAILFAATSAFVSCKDTDSDVQAELLAKIAALQTQLDNLKGQVGPQGPQGPQGPAGQNGQDGQDGQDGQNGLTPYVGENGNWWIGTTDTGVAAKGQNGQDGQNGQNGQNGQDGLTPFIGENGNWWIGTTDTGVAAKGQNGQNGLTPFIGENGNWWIGTTDTGVAAKGQNGQNGLTPFIGENGNWWIGTTDTGVSATGNIQSITDQINNLQTQINDLKTKIGDAEKALDAFNKTVESIQQQIDALGKRIQDIYQTEVTSISVDQVVNPMFELITPFGVNSNLLMTFFGEQAKRDIYFPKGADEPYVWKGDYFIEGTGNAGMLYVTVNPSSVDFTGKTLKLVSTTGNESPVVLTELVKSNKELKYITRSDNDNAFYEAYATIPQENLAKAYFTWEPTDMKAFKNQIIELIHNAGKEDIANMLQTLTNLIAGNDIPAYRLQASWGEGYYTYSPANIAAIAIKPLSFAFDIYDESQLGDAPISELEKLETHFVNRSTKTQSTRKQIWRWLNKFNQETERWLNNINWALQPTLFVEANEEISRPGVTSYTSYEPGEITLIPSSWTVELFAPAYKKYVVVKSVDGNPVKADDPVNAGLLGKVIPGSVYQIPFTVEAGKSYEIEYSALDYEGNVRTLNYYIKGNK